jgi:hypothetical protein
VEAGGGRRRGHWGTGKFPNPSLYKGVRAKAGQVASPGFSHRRMVIGRLELDGVGSVALKIKSYGKASPLFPLRLSIAAPPAVCRDVLNAPPPHTREIQSPKI